MSPRQKPLPFDQALHTAAERGDLPGIHAALAAGGNPSLIGADGRTVLMRLWSQRKGLVSNELIAVMEALVAKGASPTMVSTFPDRDVYSDRNDHFLVEWASSASWNIGGDAGDRMMSVFMLPQCASVWGERPPSTRKAWHALDVPPAIDTPAARVASILKTQNSLRSGGEPWLVHLEKLSSLAEQKTLEAQTPRLIRAPSRGLRL